MFKWLGQFKILAVLGSIIVALFAMFKMEKSKRKAAEFEADTEKGNRQFLEKEKEVIADIDKSREKWDNTQEAEHVDNIVKLEGLKNEDNDSDVVDDMLSMYNKDSDKTKTS